jgi:hypothetical protein|eukprot:CAMPEP_0168316606 /NCGR_PEP_ID=MMETSP0210-20121227/17049_1 /TAXON_ID=40633 /ORGANISM="Condylostoma magnum, Strain COL2" /LENGTH=54 /DNA_ID=CAMNT_0008300211 /DNA_START=490 /DNA_END=654 /DNA_ORIENTATION=+
MGFISGTIDMEDESTGFALYGNDVYVANQTSIRKFALFESEGMTMGLIEFNVPN